MRTISAIARRAMYAQETPEEPILLLTIEHKDINPPLRCAGYMKNVESRGHTYIAYPFDFQFPDDRDDQATSARLSIDNIGQIELEDGTKTTLVELIRKLTTPPAVAVELVLASQPDVVEAGPYSFFLRDISYDAMTVSGDMVWEDVLNQLVPGDDFNPANAPGLFK